MHITDVRAVQLTRRLERPQRNAHESRTERTFTSAGEHPTDMWMDEVEKSRP